MNAKNASTPKMLSISWAQPSLTNDDYRSLAKCFDSNWISQGSQVKNFESLVSKYSNRRYCVAVNSGSSALLCVLAALGVDKTSEVIVPASSFIAVPNAVFSLGGRLVLADIDSNTGMIDVD